MRCRFRARRRLKELLAISKATAINQEPNKSITAGWQLATRSSAFTTCADRAQIVCCVLLLGVSAAPLGTRPLGGRRGHRVGTGMGRQENKGSLTLETGEVLIGDPAGGILLLSRFVMYTEMTQNGEICITNLRAGSRARCD